MVDDVAIKYVPHLPAGGSLLLVNYDAFAPPHAAHPRVECADRVAPGSARRAALTGYINRFIPPAGAMTYLVVDTTGSMHAMLPQLARVVAESRLPGPLMLVLYGDHKDPYVVKQELVSEDRALIAAAIENAERTHGDDEPEALEDAMQFVRHDIDASAWAASSVIVFTDAEAHPAAECPQQIDFVAELDAIVASGAEVSFVLCGSSARLSMQLRDRPRIRSMTVAEFAAAPR